MKQNLMISTLARFRAFLVSALLLTILSGCGGGNGPAGDIIGPGEIIRNPEIRLSLKNSGGQVVEVIPENSWLTAIAHVTNEDGDPISSTLVTFAITDGISAGTLTPSDGRAATDAEGNARIMLNHGIPGNAGQITATAIINDIAITRTIAFSSQ